MSDREKELRERARAIHHGYRKNWNDNRLGVERVNALLEERIYAALLETDREAGARLARATDLLRNAVDSESAIVEVAEEECFGPVSRHIGAWVDEVRAFLNPDQGTQEMTALHDGTQEIAEDELRRLLGYPAGTRLSVSLPTGGGWGDVVLVVKPGGTP